jgi:hypothetical protein
MKSQREGRREWREGKGEGQGIGNKRKEKGEKGVGRREEKKKPVHDI